MEGEKGKVVCVTGASGYIGSWLVKMLLDSSYTVKATIRSLDDPKKTEHLLALNGAKERLHLFQAELIDPALKGTLNVLKSCTNVPSIRRVIITSSTASVTMNGKPVNADVIVDETWFSDPKWCEENKLWYPLSKTLAEEAAWKFAEENGIDLVTLHPGYVIGPLLQPTLNLTSEGILDFIKSGADVFPLGTCRFVDVRDVAKAHIMAFEVPSASGRYILVGTVTYPSEAMDILRNLYPSLNLPEKSENEKPVAPLYSISKEKAKSLGIDFLPLEASLKDTVESLKEMKLLSF